MPADVVSPLLTVDGFQPQCAMPPWSSDLTFAGADRQLLHGLREDLSQYQRFCEAADAEETFDLLDEILGLTTPDAVREEALAEELRALLRKLVDQCGFLLARSPGEQTQRAIDRARELARMPLPAPPVPALGHLRRLAWAAAFLLELEESPP
ncbi:DUF6415 family natural product biosynthesis protein [Streptomyces sp. NPDC021100]|uniref:DUF6415 family natural product biosynthesis protein n=1 Tax=Streptomyces sp. NPDC021100 TaxID=3365114 RepID=UPI003791979A